MIGEIGFDLVEIINPYPQGKPMSKKSKKPATPAKLESHVEFQRKLARQNREPSSKGEAIKFLLAHEEIIDQKDDDGDTPLMNACDSGCIESVEVLLARGALVNQVSDDGHTALHLTAQYAGEDDIAIAKLLIQSGALVDVVAQNGWTPLMKARASGNDQLQAFLIEKGADPKTGDAHFAAL